MKPVPILLVHGFNGQPANWTDAEDRFPEFLAQHDFDPALIRLFSYGFVEKQGEPVYDATGDMRAIAHRLDESNSDDPETRNAAIDQLSRDSVARGGPSKVTIIAHSSGGLIARYFLSCSRPDEFGTQYRGNVGKLIMLGTPHLGVDIEGLFDNLPMPIVFAILSRLHPAFPKANFEEVAQMRTDLQTMRRATLQVHASPELRDTPAYKQFRPNSDFLNALNRPGAMPREVAYFNVVGDVQVNSTMDAAGRRVVTRNASLGDMLVSVASASTIPNASARCERVVQERSLQVHIGEQGLIHAHVQVQGAHPPPLHRLLRSHPAVRAPVLKFLSAENP